MSDQDFTFPDDADEASAATPSSRPPRRSSPRSRSSRRLPRRSSSEAEEAEEAEEIVEEDPAVAFREQMRISPGDWYVIHSYAGYENKVKGNIETRITTMNMEDYIFQVEVPMEEVTEIKGGVRKLVRRNKFPGYVLVRMELTDESWGAIRHTPGVTGFVGHGHQPAPLSLDEVVSILAPAPEKKPATAGTALRVGRIGCAGRRDRLRRRRFRDRGGRSVRHAARHHLRDQHRGPEGHGPGRDLRPRNSCRAGLQPDQQELAACSNQHERHAPHHPEGAASGVTTTKDPTHHGTQEEEGCRPDQVADPGRGREPGAAGRPGPGPARRQHHGVLQGLQRRHREPAWQRHPRRDHRLRGSLVHVHAEDPAGIPPHPQGRRPREGLRGAAQGQGRHPSHGPRSARSPRPRCPT